MDLGEVAVDLSAKGKLSSRIVSCTLQQRSGDLLNRGTSSLRSDPQYIDHLQMLLYTSPQFGLDAELGHCPRDPGRMDLDQLRGLLVGGKCANDVGSCGCLGGGHRASIAHATHALQVLQVWLESG